jgi:hypothetical protein
MESPVRAAVFSRCRRAATLAMVRGTLRFASNDRHRAPLRRTAHRNGFAAGRARVLIRGLRDSRGLPKAMASLVPAAHRWRSMIVITLSSAAAACTPRLAVDVMKSDPPRFTVSGSPMTPPSRGVAELSVFGAPPTRKLQPDKVQIVPRVLLWRIRSTDGTRRVIQDVAYGEVPDGFVQKFPRGGGRPSPLQACWIYEVIVSDGGCASTSFDYGESRCPPRT